MSLINRIQVVNYLNSNRITPEWHPAYRVVTLDLHGLSTAIHATNGVGKTTLTNGIFWLLTKKKVFLDKIKSYGLAPNSTHLSHLRIELIRPLPVIGAPQMQFSMQGLPSTPKGEPWVIGLAAHRDDEKPYFYYYQGRLEESEVGRVVEGTPEVVPDEEAIENIRMAVKNKSGRIVSTAAEWREFIHSGHISKRMLASFEQFQLRGGGDKSSDLYPVTVMSGEAYDSAVFFTHIVPQLMSGIYVDSDGDNADETEEQFEDTIIASCQKLCDTKYQLQLGEEKYTRAQATLSGIEVLAKSAEEIGKAAEELDKASRKVAEMGFVVDVISESGIPGLPRWVESGEPEVDVLLKHMVVSPGEGPCIRAGGLDELLGWPSGRAAERASRESMESSRLTQVLDFVVQKHCAKSSKAPKTGRYFSEKNAIDFINQISAASLNISGDEELGRERFRIIVRKAFTHFRGQMDTSVHRGQIQAFEARLSQTHETIRRISADIAAHERTIAEANAKIVALAPSKNEWQKVQDCPEFSVEEKTSPGKLGERIDAELAALGPELGSLHQQIGGIDQSKQKLVEFRKEYGEKFPLEVMASIEGDIRTLKQSIDDAELLILKVQKERTELEKVIEASIMDGSEAASAAELFREKVIALGKIEGQFPDVAVGEIADTLSARKSRIEGGIKAVEEELVGIGASRTEAKRKLEKVRSNARGEQGELLKCFREAVEGYDLEKTRLEQAAELEISRTTGEYDKKIAAENDAKNSLDQKRQVSESAFKRSIAEVETKACTVRQFRGQAVGLHDDIERLTEDMAALLPQISILDDFDKRYGTEYTPAQILKARHEIRQRLLSKLCNLNDRLGAWNENYALLENEQPVPQRIMKQALGIIPKNFEYRRLLDVIEDAGLSRAARGAAIQSLSSVLFAPVVADNHSAAKISAALDHAGYPIPVFLEAGVQEALNAGAVNVLPNCIYGHLTSAAELLLFPEKRQESLARLAKKIAAAQKGYRAIQNVIEGMSDESEEMRFLGRADTAQKRQPREQQQKLFRELGVKGKDLSGIISKLREIAVTCGFEYGDIQASREGVSAFIDAFDEWAGRAKENLTCNHTKDIRAIEHDTSECLKRIEALRSELHEALNKIQELLKENVASVDGKRSAILEEIKEVEAVAPDIRKRFETRLSQIEAEFEKNASLANDRRNKLVKDLDSHNSQYGERSQFAKILSVAEECVQRGGREELARLEGISKLKADELENLRSKISAKTEEMAQASNKKSEEALALQRAGYSQKQFDFKAIHQFIQGGEDAALKDLVARLEKAKVEQKKHIALSKIADFKKAQHYVLQQNDEKFSQDLIANALKSVAGLKKQSDSEMVNEKEIEKQINKFSALSLKYDLSLCDIQEYLLKFNQINVEFAKFKDEADSSIADGVRQKACTLNTNTQLEDFGGELVEDIQFTLKDFDADEKIRKVKEIRSKLERVQAAYPKAVEGFLTREQKNLVPGMPEMIRETLAAPQKIRDLYRRFQETVAQELGKTAALKKQHELLWNEQVARLTMLSSQARENYQQLCAVMKTYSNAATFDISAKIASPEEISQAIERIRDMVGDEVERVNRQIEAGEMSRPRPGKGGLPKNGALQKNVREIMYRAIFRDPKITFSHPAISGGAKIRLEQSCVSEGQTAAVQLLLLVRIAEYCKKRDDRQNRSRVVKSSRENGFIILDGLFSNLSNDSLIQDSLKALDACKDVFQLIGLIHNKGYVNDFDIFPTYIVGKKFSKDNKSQEEWSEFEGKRKGENGFFHATVINTAEAV
jgi:hypothetical protein